MIVIPEQRLVESPYIEWVAHGYTVADGLEMRPAEYNWHLIFTRQAGILRILVVGALEEARPLRYVAGAETLWIRFKVGTFMPQLPAPGVPQRYLHFRSLEFPKPYPSTKNCLCCLQAGISPG